MFRMKDFSVEVGDVRFIPGTTVDVVRISVYLEKGEFRHRGVQCV